MPTTLVGGLTGPVSARSGGSTLTPTGGGIDFAIDGLPFRMAVSDKFPYERATAPFKRDQFDNAPVVGDQSLSGWWLRGQLSFHKGAGIKYYEVLEGEEVLNRYADSTAVNISDPGQVTLTPELSASAIACIDAVPGVLSGTVGVYALGSASVSFYNGTTSTAMSTSDSGSATAICTDGHAYYLANGKYIERQSASELVRHNYVAYPSFENGTTGWTLDASMAVDTTVGYFGDRSLKMTGASGTASYTVSGLTVGQTYRLSCHVLNDDANEDLTFTNVTSGKSVQSAVRGEWEQLTLYWEATATSMTFSLATSATHTAPAWADGFMVTESPYEGMYFDGDSPGGSWDGTAHQSTSTFASALPEKSFALWEHTQPDATFEKVWWAKGRLWAVDSNGRWYTLSTVGGAVSADDAFWVSNRLSGTWSLAESPGAVFIGYGSDVYAVTVDTEGTVPSVATPTVALTVPPQETISCLFYYLGHLVVATDQAVRVAFDGGNALVLGPVVTEGDFSACVRMSAHKNQVFLPGALDNHSAVSVVALDLGQLVTDLVPAWSVYAEPSNATSLASGCVHAPAGKLYVWGGSTLYTPGSQLAASGTITTGYHRFGTLEPKQFHALKVRAGGEGSIAISRVMADGSVVSLFTITQGSDWDEDITLGLVAPHEMVGLRFTLNRDAGDPTKGPVLLGYQLKALPAPRRQRLIRVPLLLEDVEQRQPSRAVGRKGDAWRRLGALEAMESSGAVFVFQDFRTGEAGQCTVESVEFVNATPPGPQDKGFGGVVTLTLRKVD